MDRARRRASRMSDGSKNKGTAFELNHRPAEEEEEEICTHDLALRQEEHPDDEKKEEELASASDDAKPATAGADDGEEDEDDDSSEEINWVEMPLDHVRWILGKKRESDPVPTLEEFGLFTQEDFDRKDADMLIRRAIASLQASQDDFFEYQAWVREVFTNNGRVMVPEDVLGPKDELQKSIDEIWYKEDGDADANAVDDVSVSEESLPPNSQVR